MPHKSLLLKFSAAGVLSLCIVGGAYGQTPEPPVCDRTPQMQNAIVAAIDGVDDCREVTSIQLAAITVFFLNDASTTELKSGDFAGLTNTGLGLHILNTQLQTLPADIFAGISPASIAIGSTPFGKGLPPALIADLKMRTDSVNINLDLVFVQDTLPTAPLALTVGNTMEVDLEDAFFYASGLNTRSPANSYEITVADNSAATAEVNGHTLTISAVSAGQTDIDVVGVRQTDIDQRATQTLTVEVTYPEPDPPVCMRTQQVRNAIVAAIAGVSACANVTGTQLAEIFALTLTDTGITELKSGDFAGLTRTGMILNMENTQLQTLPADIFDGISAHLVMTGNSFGTGLPSALIADLKTRRNTTIALDLVFVQDTLPTTPLALTVGNTMNVDLEDAFFYASGRNTRSPANSYEITVTDNSAATAAVSGHTLTISAVSAGQTDIDIAGVRSNSEQRASQMLTVEVPDPAPDPMEVPAETLKFRIKIFLEGAQ